MVADARMWLPSPGQRTLVIAHRGASHQAPENTMAAFRRAIEIGATALEMDVRLTRDGHVVVIHDRTVDRTTDGHGAVSHMTLREVRTLDAGRRFSGAFAGERIPTLEEALELAGGVQLINLELKPSLGTNLKLARAVARIVAGYTSQAAILISAFNPVALYCMHQLRPDLPLAAIVHHYPLPGRSARLVEHLVHPAALHAMVSAARNGFIARCHARGLRVNVWTVNDPRDMRRLVELGTDGILTDRVDLAVQVLREMGGGR